MSKKRTRSIRSLMGSPEIRAPNFDLNESDASDVEIEQPTKRVALRVSQFVFLFYFNFNFLFVFRRATFLGITKNFWKLNLLGKDNLVQFTNVLTGLMAVYMQ